MRKIYYDITFFIGLIIWFGGTWYFGWNDVAKTTGEKMTDSLGFLLMAYGAMNSFVRGIKTEVNIENALFRDKWNKGESQEESHE